MAENRPDALVVVGSPKDAVADPGADWAMTPSSAFGADSPAHCNHSMNSHVSRILFGGLAGLLGPWTATAAIVSLPASDSGFFNAAGRSSKNDGVVMGAAPATFNYSAGAIDEAPPLSGVDVPRKNYFTFDLSGVTGTILGATLELPLPDDGYGSPNDTETYAVYGSVFPGVPEMTGFAGALRTVYSIFSPGALAMAMDHYGKLGDTKGLFPALATVTIGEDDEGTVVSLEFTPSGIAYLNLFQGGPVVLAGEIDSLDGVPGTDEFVFGFSAPLLPGVVSPDPEFPGVTPTPMLHLDVAPVPEPKWSGVVFAALTAFAAWRSRWFLDGFGGRPLTDGRIP